MMNVNKKRAKDVVCAALKSRKLSGQTAPLGEALGGSLMVVI